MKKLILIACLALFINTIQAQFKLTAGGFRDIKDETKDYIVIDVPENTQEQLFQRTKMYLQSLYNNPNLVSSEVRNEQIVIDAIDGTDMRVMINAAGSNVWNFEYKYMFQFRDNKVKVTPYYKRLVSKFDNGAVELVGVAIMGNATGLFNSKGKCIREKATTRVEESVNSFFADYFDMIQSQQKQEEW